MLGSLVGPLGQDLTLKRIGLPVGFDDFQFAFETFHAIAMFHSDDACEAFVVDMPEDLAVIDLAGIRFFATWVVTGLKVCDLGPAQINVGNQIALGDLLMVDIEENLA